MFKDLKESSCSPREDHGMGQIPTGSLLKQSALSLQTDSQDKIIPWAVRNSGQKRHHFQFRWWDKLVIRRPLFLFRSKGIWSALFSISGPWFAAKMWETRGKHVACSAIISVSARFPAKRQETRGKRGQQRHHFRFRQVSRQKVGKHVGNGASSAIISVSARFSRQNSDQDVKLGRDSP